MTAAICASAAAKKKEFALLKALAHVRRFHWSLMVSLMCQCYWSAPVSFCSLLESRSVELILLPLQQFLPVIMSDFGRVPSSFSRAVHRRTECVRLPTFLPVTLSNVHRLLKFFQQTLSSIKGVFHCAENRD